MTIHPPVVDRPSPQRESHGCFRVVHYCDHTVTNLWRAWKPRDRNKQWFFSDSTTARVIREIPGLALAPDR
jgi:hypothetical protein